MQDEKGGRRGDTSKGGDRHRFPACIPNAPAVDRPRPLTNNEVDRGAVVTVNEREVKIVSKTRLAGIAAASFGVLFLFYIFLNSTLLPPA